MTCSPSTLFLIREVLNTSQSPCSEHFPSQDVPPASRNCQCDDQRCDHVEDSTIPRLCCSRFVRSSTRESVRHGLSLVRSSDVGLTPFTTKQEPVSAVRDLAPVAVALEHPIQPVTEDRTQVLTGPVKHVHQGSRSQGSTTSHKI